jgi:hypothetical protein
VEVLTKKSELDFIAVLLIVIGVVLMLAAFLLPAQSTQVVFEQPGLSLLVKVTPTGMVITGTDTDASVLEFAIGLAFAMFGLYRQYH